MVKRIFLKVVLFVFLAVLLPADALFAQEAEVPVQETDGKEKRKIEVAEEMTVKYSEDFSLDVRLLDISDENEPEGVLIPDGDVKLQYSSDHEEIVSITEDEQTGEVTLKAVGLGDAIVTVTAPETEEYQEAVAEITITVETTLDKGTFEDAAIVEGGILLKWNKISGAEGYYLYRSQTGKSPWSRIQTFTDGEATEYLDHEVEPGRKYYYRVKAYASSGNDVGETGETRKFVYVLPPKVSVTLSPAGNRVQWNQTAGSGGYLVYRRKSGEADWMKMASICEPGEIEWVDTTAENGKAYYYTVRTINGDSVSVCAQEKPYVRVSAPTVQNWKRQSSTKIKLLWNKNASASGYQLQYSSSSIFASKKTVNIKNNGTLSYTVSGLKKNQTYYARIRAYKTVDGKTYYSPWSVSGNITSEKTLKASVLKQKKKVFEILSQAKQNVSQYAILQGSCTDGTYAYYLLYNKNAEKCKIVKVKMSTLKVVRVSGALNVAHGNDMAYDAQKKILVVVHSTGTDPKALTSVNPDTLTIKETRHITIPNKLAGGTATDAKNATAFTGIAYSATRQEYAILLSHNYNFVILDSDMNPVRYVKAAKKNNYTMQGIDATDDYILVAQSPKSQSQKYNIITVYDWEGNYISKLNVKKGYEIESIYHVGRKYYAGFYRPYYKTYYKNVIKKVKVNGKTKKKKVKVKYRKFLRANYVYRITGL